MVNFSKDPATKKKQKAYIKDLAQQCIEGAKSTHPKGRVTRNYVLAVHKEHKIDHPYVTRARLFSAIERFQDDACESDEEKGDEGMESGGSDKEEAATFEQRHYKPRKNPIKAAERAVLECLGRRALDLKRRSSKGRLPPSTLPRMIETLQDRCPFLSVKKIEMALWRESKRAPLSNEASGTKMDGDETSDLLASESLCGGNNIPSKGALLSIAALADVANVVDAYESVIRAYGHNPPPKSREDVEKMKERDDPVYKSKKKTLLDVISKRHAQARAVNGGRLEVGLGEKLIEDAKKEFGMEDVLILQGSVSARVRRKGDQLLEGSLAFPAVKGEPGTAATPAGRKRKAGQAQLYEEEYDEAAEKAEGGSNSFNDAATLEHLLELQKEDVENLERDIAEGTDGIITDLTVKMTRDYHRMVAAQYESAKSKLLRLRAECLEAQAVVQRMEEKRRQMDRLVKQVVEEEKNATSSDDDGEE